jgi:hypothetical protein
MKPLDWFLLFISIPWIVLQILVLIVVFKTEGAKLEISKPLLYLLPYFLIALVLYRVWG